MFSFIFYPLLLARRLSGKEHPTRWRERLGYPSASRHPSANILWIHAASVGEAQTALILMPYFERLRQEAPFNLLVTTGTRTSAKLLETRLPSFATHQFVPFDSKNYVTRFLNFWRPSAFIVMESEFWPVILKALRKRDVPGFLINGRLSPRSFSRWKYAAFLLTKMLSGFRFLSVQTEGDAKRLGRFTKQDIFVAGNLKYAAVPLPCDEAELTKLQQAIGTRPTIVYASTHDGEEAMVAELHKRLKQKHPDVLSIIVPRHPERGAEIAASLNGGLKLLRRSQNHALPQADTDIYLADTLGELGLFYRLSKLAFVGRSFSKDGGGGHNPLEPALLGCAVLCGPNVQNLQAIYDDMQDAGILLQADNETSLFNTLETYLAAPKKAELLGKKAKEFAHYRADVLDRLLEQLDAPLTAALKN